MKNVFLIFATILAWTIPVYPSQKVLETELQDFVLVDRLDPADLEFTFVEKTESRIEAQERRFLEEKIEIFRTQYAKKSKNTDKPLMTLPIQISKATDEQIRTFHYLKSKQESSSASTAHTASNGELNRGIYNFCEQKLSTIKDSIPTSTLLIMLPTGAIIALTLAAPGVVLWLIQIAINLTAVTLGGTIALLICHYKSQGDSIEAMAGKMLLGTAFVFGAVYVAIVGMDTAIDEGIKAIKNWATS